MSGGLFPSYPSQIVYTLGTSQSFSAAVVLSDNGGQYFFIPPVACTIVLMNGTVTGTAAASTQFNLYGSAQGGGAGAQGTAITVSATGNGSNATSFSSTRSLVLRAGDYMGVAFYPTTSQVYSINVQLWATFP